uniref:Ig-like domain-containing protein n=1 Tax=Nothoprocta perdicaria TaxID=30464 RepID=A0A8C6ZRU7_NOTPE
RISLPGPGAALPAPASPLEVHVARAAVLAVEGEGAVLPVWYSSRSRRPPYVTWLLHPPHGDPFQTPLQGRASFVHAVAASRNLSVLINGTREADSGQYVCTVNVPGEAAGRNVAVVNLTVLVPPGTPACRLLGSPGVGRDVTLSCAARHGKPLPAYRWQRAPPAPRRFFPPAHGTRGHGDIGTDMRT